MNYNHLHYFNVIAQEGSIARASRRLNVSQPTLSEQLKQLEEFLQAKLFDRNGGALRLNNQGRQALKFTEPMFELGERLSQTFKTETRCSKTRLEIGLVATSVRSVTIDRLVSLFKDEKTMVRIRQGDNQFLLHELVSSGLDILITDSLPRQAQERGIESRVIVSPKLTVIGNRRAVAALTEKPPASLHNQPFIHYTSQSSYRWEIDQYFNEHAVEPNPVAEADDVYVIREAVRDGIGFGIVPSSILNDEREDSEVVSIHTVDRPFEIYALFNVRNPADETLRALDILTRADDYLQEAAE